MGISGSVSINQASLFARGLAELGHEPEQIFNSVGLKISTENDPTTRLSIHELVALGKACEQRTGDPGIGHKLYSRIQLAYLDSFGISLLYSSDLLEFIRRFKTYLPYALSRAAIDIFEGSDGYYIFCNWNLGLNVEDQQRISEWFSCAFVSMCTEALGKRLVVDKVLLETEPSRAMQEVLENHALDIVHGQDQYGFVLSKSSVSQRLPLANPQMAQAAEELTLQYLEAIEADDIALRVERKIVEGLTDGDFTKESIANSLGISVSSLHERLSHEQTSYSDLLESIRKRRALQYIRSDSLRISQIAYSLGFQNPSNFSRAFKTWTGMTPGEYRSQVDQ